MNRRRLLALFGISTVASVAYCRPAGGIPELGRWLDRLSIRLSDGLSNAERQLAAAIADTVIPRTDTPGAVDVGVPAFIDHMLAAWYTTAERRAFQLGLRTLDRKCRTEHRKAFFALDHPNRLEFLGTLDGKAGPAGSAEDAFTIMRRLTVHGYLTSQWVQTRLLKASFIPGRFDGCVVEPA